jgi:hypothetical protein
MSNHYIAHDLRSQSETYASHYTQAEKEKFLQHYRYAIATTETEDKKLLEDLFLGIYANPVDTQVHL